MQFPTLLVMAALAMGVQSALYKRAICKSPSKDPALKGALVFDEQPTIKACEAYKNRNTGTAKWDSCGDCFFFNKFPPENFCRSNEGHIGSDEWHYYCTLNGATDSEGKE